MRYFVAAILVLLIPALSPAAGAPRWSLELKGGAFFPAAENWSRYYGSSYIGEWGGAVSYKPERHIEVGIEGSYLSASGKGVQPQHEQQDPTHPPGGKVTYRQVPLNLFVLARGVFREDQLLVPYAGGGFSRVFYRTRVEGGDKRSGSVNGYHARGGVQVLLDRLEADSARNLYEDFGIHHTYLFVEGKYTRARADTATGGSANIGGTSWLGGLLFEF